VRVSPDAQLSPDGKLVAYGVQVENFQGPGDIPRKLYVRGVSDKKGDDLDIQGIVRRWAPDGRKLAVAAFTGGRAEHWLVDVKGREKTALKLPDSDLLADWSPDGRWLVTTLIDQDATPPRAQIYLVKPDGSGARALTRPDTLALVGRLSPDGRKLLFMSGEKKGDRWSRSLYVADLAGGKPVRVSQELNADIQGYCWSPDGKRVAYVWRQSGGKADQETESFLMVVDADGKNAVTVLSEKGESSGVITLAAPEWR